MADKGMSSREAADFVDKLDKQLMKWTKFLYGVDWQDPSLYDLVVNLHQVSIDGAVQTIVRMARLDDFRPTDESRNAFDDLLLSSIVWAALTADQRTRTANVRVAAANGAVFITGIADGERALAAVREVAAGVDGVKEVHSEVGVGRHWQW
jgi:BON domain/Cytidylate kinase-like family